MESRRLPEEGILEEELCRYVDSGMVPMHMPGHKRIVQASGVILPDQDLTEVEGVDDLHHATGILRKAMERTAGLYGADRTWYLVGGSTCGILAGIWAAVSYGDEVIAARNCHRSVYHAAELLNLTVHWIVPAADPVFGICGSIRPEQIREVAECYPASRAVILTSPTYEGVVSDIGTIAGICHSNQMTLIVDEAHGAHLGLFPEGGFPAGALQGGADLVIQSPHKTLLSVTQTAWLHLQGSRVDADRVERALDIFETSSPSYPLMTSLDGCTGLLSHRGNELFACWKEQLDRFDEEISSLRRFSVIGHSMEPVEPGRSKEGFEGFFFRFDRSKIPIYTGRADITGAKLAEILRQQYHIETEMSCGKITLAMTGAGDAFGSYEMSGLHKLARALCETDQRPGSFAKENTGYCPVSAQKERKRPECAADGMCRIETDRTIAEALRAAEKEAVEVPLLQAEGRICAEYIYSYPPGIPILAPGERITAQAIGRITELESEGTQMYRRSGNLETIRCLKEAGASTQ